jgi:hypothetical protein
LDNLGRNCFNRAKGGFKIRSFTESIHSIFQGVFIMASLSITTPTETHVTNEKSDHLNAELEALLEGLMVIGMGALSKIA